MTELYGRILLWHKLVAMQTGGLALCSAKRKLNRDEAKGWAAVLRNVADEIDAFLDTGAFILDDKGQRVVQSGQVAALEGSPVDCPGSKPRTPSEIAGTAGSTQGAVSRKAGGLRVATRKKQ